MLQPIPNLLAHQIGTDMHISPALKPDLAIRNRVTYGALADEYEHPAHTTIADFHRLTRALFELQATRIQHALSPVLSGDWLVAGVGTGANVADFIAAAGRRPRRLEAADLCPEMLEHARCSSVTYDRLTEIDLTREIAPEAAQFHAILAFLADPYLDEQGLRSLGSRLRPGGRLVVTVPTRSWAKLVRRTQHPDESWFNLRSGHRVSAPSYCWDLEGLVALGARGGLSCLLAETAVHTDAMIESAVIREAARLIESRPLEVISLVVLLRDAACK